MHLTTCSMKAWSTYRLAVLGTKSGDSRKRRKNSYTNYKMFMKHDRNHLDMVKYTFKTESTDNVLCQDEDSI